MIRIDASSGARTVRLIIAFVFMLLTLPALADSSCLIDKYQRYADAKGRFQEGITALTVALAPAYREVAEQYRDDQLAMIDASRLAVEFLARTHPAQLHTAKPLNQWLQLDAAQRQDIARHDARYAELEALRQQRRERPAHEDGDALRALMRTEVMPSERYRELAEQLGQATADANAIRCH